MTRTYRIADADRPARLERAASRVRAEARALYFAAREARALYELETREREREARDHSAARADLAAAMAKATTRDYASTYYQTDTSRNEWNAR